MPFQLGKLLLILFSVSLVGICLVFALLPFFLAAVTCLRQKRNNWNKYRSSLYFGRVWHSRFVPVSHSFTYPLFLFCLDLHDEVEKENLFGQVLWPLSLLMNFSERDHLKNQEGMRPGSTSKGLLSERIMRLVADRTQQRFVPSTETHRILLLTHLSYYGYCFNPVSFYYIQNKASGKTDAVVGEVSNTPWNEMHCYVLHETSVNDVSTCVLLGKVDPSKASENTPCSKINYVFPKQFHVSPFMEMEYKYDWTFAEKLVTLNAKNDSETTITIINEMRSTTENKLCFRANMKVERKSMHPFQMAFYVTTYPVYCLIIQVWIHYEAFCLFVKGVAFQPHPAGTETFVSRAIGNAMRPFFTLQDYFASEKKKPKDE